MTARTVGASLAESVDAALALFVAGGIPGEVVVHDGGESVLEVDAFGQAVGGDQDAGPVVGGEVVDAGSAFLRRQGAGDGLDPRGRDGFGERSGEVLGEVLGGRDVAAEDDRVVAVGEEIPDDRDEPS